MDSKHEIKIKNRVYIKASDAASVAGVDKQTIHRWLKNGSVKGHKPAGSNWWLVDKNSLNNYLSGRD